MPKTVMGQTVKESFLGEYKIQNVELWVIQTKENNIVKMVLFANDGLSFIDLIMALAIEFLCLKI